MRTTLFAKVLIALSFTLCLTGCPKPEAAANADQQASQQSRLAQMLGLGKKSEPAPATTTASSSISPIATAEAGEARGSFGVSLTIIDTKTIPADSMATEGTLQQAGKDNPKAEKGVDYDTFAYPVINARKNPQGYPVYLLSCDDQGQCISWGNKPVGSINDVAATITQIRNADVIAKGYNCDKLCYDADGHIVGAPSPAMVAWVQTHPNQHY